MSKQKFTATASDGTIFTRSSSRLYEFAVVGFWCGKCLKDGCTRCEGKAYFSMTLEAAQTQLRQIQNAKFDTDYSNRSFELVKVGA